MAEWLLIALASAGWVGAYPWRFRSVSAATASPVRVYAISARTCAREQQKADALVAALARAGMTYTLHYVDQEAAAGAALSQKLAKLRHQRPATGSLEVRFPVVAVRDTLWFDPPSLGTLPKHQ